MPTTTLTCNKDARIALSGGTNLGAGTSDFLPVGLYSGYKYRSLLGFSGFSASWVSITSAVLHIKTSSQYYVAFGSDPDIEVLRLTSSWSEGSSSSLSSSNAVHWGNQPSATTSNQATKDVTTSENTWVSITITALMQDALAAGVFYGLRIMAADETTASDVTEFYAREYGSNDAYIDVTYTTNVAPSAPTFSAPTASQIVVPDPTITFAHNDSDGDALLKYDLQVSTDSTFASVTHLNASLSTVGISGNNVSGSYSGWGGTALTRGTTYYVRARTYSSAGILTAGAWSSARAFVANSLPTTSLTQPGATGRTAKLAYTAGAGWTTPRLVVAWSYADAQAAHATQVKYQVFIKNDADGTTFYDSGEVTSSAATLTVPSNLTEGNKYRIKVQVYDGVEWSGYSTELTVRARWGYGLYRYDMGSAPTTLALDTLATTTSATSEVAIEYSSNTTTATPSTFYATVGSVPLQRYFFWQVYLFAWDSATPTSPSLDQLVIDYSSVILVPDNWTRSDTSGTVIVADTGSYVYGSRSLRISADGSKYAYQLVSILPNTNYILQVRQKSTGNSGGTVFLADTSSGSAITTGIPVMAATQDFTRAVSAVWNSGSRSQVYVVCKADGSAGTFAWFDAIKLEASSVATPWTPGFVGGAIAIDAGGVQVDASAGGVMRLRGSTGGSRDLIEIGATGLKLGGDLELDSPEANVLRIQGPGGIAVSYRNGGSTFPASPDTGDVFWRTDHRMHYFYDGTRWLCTCLHTLNLDDELTNLSATDTDVGRIAPFPSGPSAGGIFVEDLDAGYHVAAGTALSASHKWTVVVQLYDVSAAGNATIATKTIDSGASAVWRRDAAQAVDAVVAADAAFVYMNVTKTGTPGNLYFYPALTYRFIAT